jgi:hypothetical protein
MALPTKTDLLTMDYSYQGQPFVDVPAQDSIVLSTMDYTYQGQPFVRNEAGGAVVTVTPLRCLMGIGT